MSYRTYSFITKTEGDNELLKAAITKEFPFHWVREIFTPFRGVVCQVFHSYREVDYQRFPDQRFKNQEEVEDYFENHTENHLVTFSKAHPKLSFAFVEVDCFGGKCSSNGYILKNGEKIFENEPHHSGHMELLARLDPVSQSWFFYPFRRSFFQDKGGFHGELVNVAFPALWMVLDIDYGKNPAYDFQAFENEMLLTKIKEYDLYLMKVDEERVKVMGTFEVMSEENVEEVKQLIHECFGGMLYYFSLDNFETGEQMIFQTMDDELAKRLAATSYRANAFNERPFIYDDIEEERETEAVEKEKQPAEKEPQAKPAATVVEEGFEDDSQQEKSSGFLGFFKKLFGKG
jgi:hypothetical protein